jgi:hypothetical protein
MAKLPGRDATRQLTRIGLVLSHRPARGDWLSRGAMALAGLLVGAAAASQYREVAAPALPPPPVGAVDPQPLQRRLDQSLLSLRLSEARGTELEHQIATLVQQQRECQEELSFFRKARDGKH